MPCGAKRAVGSTSVLTAGYSLMLRPPHPRLNGIFLLPLRLSARVSHGLHFEDDERVKKIVRWLATLPFTRASSRAGETFGKAAGGQRLGFPRKPHGALPWARAEKPLRADRRRFPEGLQVALTGGGKRSGLNNSWRPREGDEEKPGAW